MKLNRGDRVKRTNLLNRGEIWYFQQFVGDGGLFGGISKAVLMDEDGEIDESSIYNIKKLTNQH